MKTLTTLLILLSFSAFSQDIWNEKRLKEAEKLKMSKEQILQIAALVEKDAKIADEKPLLAGVFINRHKKGMRLEDASNLPKPSVESIDAVLDYKDHDFLYYSPRPNGSGYHDFSITPVQHREKMRVIEENQKKKAGK